MPFVDGTVNTGQTDEYVFRRGNAFWFAYRFQPERFSEIDRASAFHNIPGISYLLSGGKDVPCAVPLRFCRKYAEHLEDCGKDTSDAVYKICLDEPIPRSLLSRICGSSAGAFERSDLKDMGALLENARARFDNRM